MDNAIYCIIKNRYDGRLGPHGGELFPAPRRTIIPELATTIAVVLLAMHTHVQCSNKLLNKCQLTHPAPFVQKYGVATGYTLLLLHRNGCVRQLILQYNTTALLIALSMIVVYETTPSLPAREAHLSTHSPAGLVAVAGLVVLHTPTPQNHVQGMCHAPQTTRSTQTNK
eukprot:9470287-Pyramimonas_sp.AAC.1